MGHTAAMSGEHLDPRRRAFLLPGAPRVLADGRAAPLRVQVGPGCLAEQRVACRLCGDGCTVDAIRFRPRLGAEPLPGIDDSRCTGCGDCLPLCPVQALKLV